MRRAALLAALAVLAPAAPASASSLYSGPGPRPGPAILYAPAADAPQLQNAPGSVWHADPILVSGAAAYRHGEWLYQDFLYDDSGAHAQNDPHDPRLPGNVFSQNDGTYTYPTDPRYAQNAADLVEFRVKPLSDSTAFRVTLNSMNQAATQAPVFAFTIAIGGAAGVTRAFPYGANVRAPAAYFLTVHPTGAPGALTADLRDAATGAVVPGAVPSVTLDHARRQVEVDVAHATWDPGAGRVRMAVGVGLWNQAAGSYLLPAATASATQPGGGGVLPNPPAFFNVGPRTSEPIPEPRAATFVPDTAKAPAWWRDQQQGTALAAGDISPIYADVDFAKLRAGTDDDSAIPTTGPIDRILASHFELHQGLDSSKSCTSRDQSCEYGGRLEPYALYVPTHEPAGGYGMTLLLHALFTNYNLFEGTRNQSEFGERSRGSLVLTPESRGADGNYAGLAGVEVFEAWADVARHYDLNPDWTAITGYSMGGIGTFKLAEQFPDLFGKAQSTSGDDSNGLEASLRNVPVLMWNMAVDEEVTFPGVQSTFNALDAAGYRYAIDLFAPGEHNSFYLSDEYGPAATWLGNTATDRNPSHVTFAFDPSLDFGVHNGDYGFTADHAYWLSGLAARGSGHATINVVSRGFPTGDAVPTATQHGAGTVLGGTIPVMAYASQYRDWRPAPAQVPADELDVTATNVATVTVDPGRANVTCNAPVRIHSDGPIAVTLAGCNRVIAR